jgi:hypothetical protein
MPNPLGKSIESWFESLVGLRVTDQGLARWKDLANPEVMIFDYPHQPGTYCFIFPTQVDSPMSEDMQVFLFLEVVDKAVSSVSYSVISVSSDGRGTLMTGEVLEPDRAVIENVMRATVDPNDHDKLHAAIADRIRRMSDDEIEHAIGFFTHVYNDEHQRQKYGRVLDERRR